MKSYMMWVISDIVFKNIKMYMQMKRFPKNNVVMNVTNL